MTATTCTRCHRMLQYDTLLAAEFQGLDSALCQQCAEGKIDMTTGFAGALDHWADVTYAVLEEWAILAQGAISDEVRTAEVARPVDYIRADMLRVAVSGDPKRTACDVYGLRMLALLLNDIAGEADEGVKS